MQNRGSKFEEAKDEAAFYGPKIDFMATDAIGREHQVATVQLDFVMPERFGLEYTAEDDSKQTPVMIHCALLGSIERFLSVYIEHTAGRFPVWLAPEQVRILSLNDDPKIVTFAEALVAQAKAVGLRVSLDSHNESVGKKIRQAELMKIPYTIVVGQKEVDSSQVLPRIRADLRDKPLAKAVATQDFLNVVADEAASRTNTSSL